MIFGGEQDSILLDVKLPSHSLRSGTTLALPARASVVVPPVILKCVSISWQIRQV
jgi:hypothetical protein